MPTNDSAVSPLLRHMDGRSIDDLLDLACMALDMPGAMLLLSAPPGRVRRGTLKADVLDGVDLAAFHGTGGLRVVEDTRADATLAHVARLGFYAGVPVELDGETKAILAVFDACPRAFPASAAAGLERVAGVVAGLLRMATRTDAITREAQGREADLVRYRKMYERSSSLARIGVWECDLVTGELTWTDGIYDIFGLPRGSPITRETALRLYSDESREQMERLRSRCVAEGGGFTLDIEVRTMTGQARWVRLSAEVETVDDRPARIFGTKQDITLERQLMDRLRVLAECDPLTGIANRGVFEARLAEAAAAGEGRNRLAALVIVDIDGFKQINDTFGHAAGDECLREVARRLRGVFGADALVARIGGDEFGVLAFGPREEAAIASLAACAVASLAVPFVWRHRPVSINGSMGVTLAGSPAHAPSDLFAQADRALYAAKAAGRSTYCLFDPQRHRPGQSGRRPVAVVSRNSLP
ncbi:diguanylate cyclase domain-containing protein [Ancylobacter radicis]|uniref:GGDEF domain-containing protein n=1 Tax=Ancylobacter radicis TaxID=2836179 RepID=A0ABS5R1U8_9HYPH|nr:GGDEF domain-containing protein [Ancylobacter radicis]